MSAINQKEYLKKYLGIGKAPGEKKKKKKPKGIGNKVKIIDDDVDVNLFAETKPQDEIDEDAPQIVAIIDERPLPLRYDDENKRALWEPIGTPATEPIQSVSNQKQMITEFKISKPAKVDDADRSPPRRRKKVDNSPPRKKIEREDNDDYSPPRRSVKKEVDSSPPRKRDEDNSPPRKIKRDEDNSPPRKARRKEEEQEKDNSPPRKNRKVNKNDVSPARKSRWGRENSPPRKSRKENSSSSRQNADLDDIEYSPPREIQIKQEKQDINEPQSSSSKMRKTLDGKTAGLQNAKDLVEETRQYKKRENDLFKNLSKDVSGVNAQTVVRDRKTGRIRDLAEEDERKRKKEQDEQKQKEKYTRWGRGLVQVENRARQIEEEIHEMSKPLARYADDEDLERYLKEQEREGDPMLAYIRSKKRKDDIKAGKVVKPQFQGEFMPNRYGIRPGHRWDGVDRSNGYEKKWFEVQNAKRAQMEDSYKWSTEDM